MAVGHLFHFNVASMVGCYDENPWEGQKALTITTLVVGSSHVSNQNIYMGFSHIHTHTPSVDMGNGYAYV